ncbi:helix-turn-helix domain-containing protein [Cystobacter ferrugineus]|uniref:helix-turn-helix domain-containing protein n=1 Tax=Cystobacter ferrugineus TaxID=83449 RepID=UPI000903BA94|nr:helix-turn-helix transcriptional regulator [Cystobacter ferrugineus]
MDEKLQRLLGEAARAARLWLGLTQAEVAKKVGLKSGVYGQVERGMMLGVLTRRRMCETLGISPRTCSCSWVPKPTRAITPALRPGPVRTRTSRSPPLGAQLKAGPCASSSAEHHARISIPTRTPSWSKSSTTSGPV